ncbi:MAG: hypothetical protein QW472_01670 [Candidatus Aenigmatarchaeota archaeon]
MSEFTIVVEFEDGQRKCYSSDVQERNYQYWESLLRKAHRKKVKLYCNCCSSYPLESKKLYVAYYRDSDTYVIKTYPRTKERHAVHCFFRRGVITISYRGDQTEKVRRPFESIVKQDKDAVILIPEIGIRSKTVKVKRKDREEKLVSQGKSYSVKRTKIFKFLSTIWEMSDLNVWSPKKYQETNHDPLQVLQKSGIKRSIRKIFISKTKSLDTLLLLPCKSKEDEQYLKNVKILKRCMKRRERPFLLNFFPRFDEKNIYLIDFFVSLGLDSLLAGLRENVAKGQDITSAGIKCEVLNEENKSNDQARRGLILLPVKYYYGIPFLWVDIEYLDFFKKKDNQAMLKLYMNRGCEIVYFAHLDVPKEITEESKTGESRQDGVNIYYNSRVLNICFMFVSKELIPIESSYEAQMEAFLRSLKVKFKKPFVSSDFPLVPDFIIFDREDKPSIYVEVFGMHTKEYLQRKQEKLDFYSNKGVRVLSWDPKNDPNFKKFKKEFCSF